MTPNSWSERRAGWATSDCPWRAVFIFHGRLQREEVGRASAHMGLALVESDYGSLCSKSGSTAGKHKHAPTICRRP
jgi:hypothetical protein